MPAIYRWDGTNAPTKVAGTDQLSLVELTDMNDVAISSPTNGQALVYNSMTHKWENGQGGSVIDELNDIGDVNITNPTDRQSLVYDYQNGEWVNGDAASADYSFDTVAEMLAAIAGGTVEDGATIYVDEDSDDEWRFIPISYADFMALPEAQRENGRYLVTGMSPMVNAYSVTYKDGKSVGQELDDVALNKVDLVNYGGIRPGEAKTFVIPKQSAFIFITGGGTVALEGMLILHSYSVGANYNPIKTGTNIGLSLSGFNLTITNNDSGNGLTVTIIRLYGSMPTVQS